MFSIWLNMKGELLPENQTINSSKYSEKLDCFKGAIQRKRLKLPNRKGVSFHHDSARSHTFCALVKNIDVLIQISENNMYSTLPTDVGFSPSFEKKKKCGNWFKE